MDNATKNKWDRAALFFDVMAGYGAEKRWEAAKTELFSHMNGKVLFLAVGTGLDIPCFPENKDIYGIDISPKMLEKAENRVQNYVGNMTTEVMDVHDLDMEDNCFDQVFTSCTFCSVPNPVKGLKSLYRVLKPGGELLMFEHTGSRYFPISLMMNVMTPLTRQIGPEMNRKTVDNVQQAGFDDIKVTNVYLDVVKIIRATKRAP
ncbi:MAG: class I SAM-dependent methyltransferase [Pseudomonadales bacterium]|nr:class I SAM-dependent methyltransferase [Pseudomonadales bacterium]